MKDKNRQVPIWEKKLAIVLAADDGEIEAVRTMLDKLIEEERERIIHWADTYKDGVNVPKTLEDLKSFIKSNE